METTSSIKHYKSKNDYLQKNASKPISKAKELVSGKSSNPKSVEDSVKISDDAKAKASEVKSDLKENLKSGLKEGKSSLKNAGVHLLADAASAALNVLPSPLKVPALNFSSTSKTASTKEDIKNSMPINKPGIFFVEGLSLGGLSSGDEGLRELSEAVNGAETFSWSDEDEVFELIKRRPKEQPIVLVGHSLGGDTIVNLTNRLNSIEGGFRKVDLVVTLDSVGFNNDIIPQNVKRNINYISGSGSLFSDGPNIARDSKLTDVANHLKGRGHTELDEDNDIHFDIVTNIHEVLGEFKHTKRVEKLTSMYDFFKK